MSIATKHGDKGDTGLIGGARVSKADVRVEAYGTVDELVAALTAHVARIEATEGLLSDWSLPGDHAAAAAYDVARTVSRRAERAVVRLSETGAELNPHVVPYLNRLSDLLWLLGRLLELRAGVDTRLRDDEHKGPR